MRQHGQSSTIVVESAELELPPVQLEDYRSSSKKPSISGRSLRSAAETWDEDRNETLPAPTTAAPEESESWNSSTGTIWKVSAAFWSFAVMGLNDATYGAIIPYLQPFYSLRYAIVSLIFLSPFIGYTLSAVLNNAIHLKFGQRGVAFVGPLCHLLAYIINAVHPPYPVLVISFILAGFGNGLLDAGWNAWIGAMLNANEILGFLHAFYGLGATIAPLIATAMITRADLPWYYWYYCMIGFAVAELAISLYAFWEDTGAKFRERNARTSDETGSRLREATMKMPAARITWLCAMFLLGYVGVEVALGGWIVEFMIKVRDAEKFAAGMSATGFWLGMTVGRVILGFVTPRIGEKLSIMVCTYIMCCTCATMCKPLRRTYADPIYLTHLIILPRSTSQSPSDSNSSSG